MVAAALDAACNAAARRIEPKPRQLGLEIKPDVVAPEQVHGFIRREIERYGAVLRAAGVKPE